MTRRRLGTHGKPLMWTDNKVRMTIRPEPTVLDDTDLAMLLGHRLDIQHDYYCTNGMDAHKAIDMIWQYENDEQKLTQKHALELVSDGWFLENYNQGSDTHEAFDRNEPHHLVLLSLVHRIWPQFAMNLSALSPREDK
tara:strand:+ start:37 stop:450 length:414 start_codon:yes stop_codon:yes gene_type:complete